MECCRLLPARPQPAMWALSTLYPPVAHRKWERSFRLPARRPSATKALFTATLSSSPGNQNAVFVCPVVDLRFWEHSFRVPARRASARKMPYFLFCGLHWYLSYNKRFIFLSETAQKLINFNVVECEERYVKPNSRRMRKCYCKHYEWVTNTALWFKWHWEHFWNWIFKKYPIYFMNNYYACGCEQIDTLKLTRKPHKGRLMQCIPKNMPEWWGKSIPQLNMPEGWWESIPQLPRQLRVTNGVRCAVRVTARKKD